MFVIWHGFLTPHLNTHNRWSRGGERAKERQKQKELQRQLLVERRARHGHWKEGR